MKYFYSKILKPLWLSQKTGFTPHSQKLRRSEIALMAGILLSLSLGSWAQQGQNQLAEGMIRLHVVANSDSPADQSLKLKVRDQILAVAETLYQEGLSPEETRELFQAHLPELTQAGQAVAGDYVVEAQLADLWFPTKEYQDFSLPAGNYAALQVNIGQGEGENWWCVAYPPLCLGAASQTLDQAVEAGNFTSQEQRMITGEGYVLKFKSMEILGNVQKFLKQ